RHVRDALAEFPPKDDRATIARERLAVLGRRVSHVTVRLGDTVPPGSRVSQDGEELAPALIGKEQPIDAGAHAFLLTLPDGKKHRLDVTLREGESRAVLLDPP